MPLNRAGRAILKAELALAKYPPMTTPDVLAELQINVGGQRETITGGEIYDAIDRTEARALDAEGIEDLREILAVSGEINITGGSKGRTLLMGLFPSGTTFTALQGLVTIDRTRLQDLGIVEPTLHEIDVAMGRYVEP